MPTAVFLRAVNVGGNNRVPMKPLAALLERETGAPVLNYLQSGNLIFAAERLPGDLADLASSTIRAEHGLEIAVVARPLADLETLLQGNPWPEEDAKRVHLSMWDSDHPVAAAEAMLAADWGGDEIVFAGTDAWLHFATSFHEAKLGNHVIERRLKVVATARNAQTIAEVIALAQAL